MEDSEAWDDNLLRLWMYCLFRANYADKVVLVGRLAKPITVKRGQFITGRHSLHAALYPKKREHRNSPSTVWRRLETLEKLGNLNIETNSRYSLVTIVHYDTYNPPDSKDEQVNEQQANSRRTAGEQQTSTEKKRKKVKKGNNTILAAISERQTQTEAEFIRLWNSTQGVRCNRGNSLAAPRRAVFRTRLENKTWFDDFREALTHFPLRCFQDDDDPWRPNVDWILKPRSVIRILEREYDWSKGRVRESHPPVEAPMPTY